MHLDILAKVGLSQLTIRLNLFFQLIIPTIKISQFAFSARAGAFSRVLGSAALEDCAWDGLHNASYDPLHACAKAVKDAVTLLTGMTDTGNLTAKARKVEALRFDYLKVRQVPNAAEEKRLAKEAEQLKRSRRSAGKRRFTGEGRRDKKKRAKTTKDYSARPLWVLSAHDISAMAAVASSVRLPGGTDGAGVRCPNPFADHFRLRDCMDFIPVLMEYFLYHTTSVSRAVLVALRDFFRAATPLLHEQLKR